MAPIRVAGFGYTGQAMSRWTNSLNSIFILDKIRPRKSFFTSLLNLIFRNNFERMPACLVIHFLTNQMQIKLNSMKKIETRFCKFLVNLGPYGEYFHRLFLSLTGIFDAENKNHPLWDQKSSLFLGSEIIEARNQRIW